MGRSGRHPGEERGLGGIVAVVPGRFGIGVYSPRVDVKGNSVRGAKACDAIARRFGLHAFAVPGEGEDFEAQLRPARGRRRREVG